MEEKKLKVGTKAQNENSEKLSYEQLEQVARDLSMQCRQLRTHLSNAQKTINEFNDLSMLLDIIRLGENFSSEFIVRCTDRVEKMVTNALEAYDKIEAEALEHQGKSENKG